MLTRPAPDKWPHPGAVPVPHALAQADDWSLSDVLCGAGPADPAFEERHERVAIAAVSAGSFRYRTGNGSALLYPGSVLLGNAGSGFECSHEHSTGDRCLAVHIEREAFAEIAASIAGSSRFAFRAAALPALPAVLPALVEIECLHGGARDSAAEDLVLRYAESIITIASGAAAPRSQAMSARDERRIGEALRAIELDPADPPDLAGLAALAAMSKYHFLRCFRRLTGTTPHQFLLGRRMHRAAIALQSTDAPVATIVADAGFGDLSTFNQRFRTLFGATPSGFRARSHARREAAPQPS